MSLDKKIISEIERYRTINKYIIEQTETLPTEDLGALAPPPPADAGAVPPPPTEGLPVAEPEKIDVENDPDVEKLDDEGNSDEKTKDTEGGTEELEITDLVDSQKNIESKQEEYFSNLFNQLETLQSKLGEMDQIMNKLNTLENKIEKYREKTPQEKLELRTYDSYPFNQKLSDFFEDKQDDMEKTGKNDYVLTTDEVTDINPSEIKSSFSPSSNDDGEYKTY